MSLSRRFRERAERPIHRDSFVTPWPDVGLVVADSPNDPAPSLRLAHGHIVRWMVCLVSRWTCSTSLSLNTPST